VVERVDQSIRVHLGERLGKNSRSSRGHARVSRRLAWAALTAAL